MILRINTNMTMLNKDFFIIEGQPSELSLFNLPPTQVGDKLFLMNFLRLVVQQLYAYRKWCLFNDFLFFFGWISSSDVSSSMAAGVWLLTTTLWQLRFREVHPSSSSVALLFPAMEEVPYPSSPPPYKLLLAFVFWRLSLVVVSSCLRCLTRLSPLLESVSCSKEIRFIRNW